MVPYVAYYTLDIRIRGEIMVPATSVEDAIRAAKAEVRARRVSFSYQSSQFGNLKVNENEIEWFVQDAEDGFFQVTAVSPQEATATVNVTAGDLASAELEIQDADVQFKFKNIPIYGFSAADATHRTLTVKQRTPTVLSATAPNTPTVGASNSITVTVTGATTSGTGSLYQNGVIVSTFSFPNSSVVVVPSAPLTPGVNTFLVVFDGTETLAPTSYNFVATAAGKTSTVTVSGTYPTSVYAGTPINLIAEVDSPVDTTHVPTGTVTYESGAVKIRSQALTATGAHASAAIFTFTPPVGSYSGIARIKYAGDNFLAASQSSLLANLVVNIIPCTVDGSALVADIGSPTTISGTITTPVGTVAPAYGVIVATISGVKIGEGDCVQGTDGRHMSFSFDTTPFMSGTLVTIVLTFTPSDPVLYGAGTTSFPYTAGAPVATPTISSLYVTALPAASSPIVGASESMTLVGSNIVTGAKVEINGTLYTAAYSGGNLVFNAPALAEGYYTLRVQNPDLQFSAYSEIEYVTASTGLAPSKLWEQQGDNSDYSPTPGVDWMNRVGGGSAWIQPTAGNRPAVAATVNGKAPIEFHGTGKYLTCTESMNTMGTNEDLVMSFLVKIPAGLYWNPAAFYASSCLMSDSGQYWYLVAGEESGSSYVGIGMYGDAPNPTHGVRVKVTPDTWTMITIRHTNKRLFIEANAAPTGGAQSVAGNAGGRGKVLENGTAQGSGNGMNASTYGAAPGALMLSMFAKQSATDLALHSLYKFWRLRMYPSAGLPAVTFSRATTAEVGGSTVTVRGFGFRPGLVVKTDGVARVTVWVDETTATAVVPAHATGTVSVEVVNTNGSTSGVVANALEYYSIAALSLTAYADARDLVPASFPAAITWAHRASAGNSGSKIFYRKPSATRNPVSTTFNGKPTAQFVATSFTDHTAFYFATTGAPTTPVVQTLLWSLTNGGSGWITISTPAGTSDAAASSWLNPSPLNFEYPAYALTLAATLTGWQVLVTRNSPTYYYATDVIKALPNTMQTVCFKMDEVSRTIWCKVGKSQWRSITVPADSGLTMYKAINELIMGIAHEPGAQWNAPTSGYVSQIGTADSLLSDTDFEKIVDVNETVFATSL